MSRAIEWQLYHELRETIEQVLEDFLDEENLYTRPRLVIEQDIYGNYIVHVSEYVDTDPRESDDVYKYIRGGDIDYEAVDELASQFVDLR